jgi:putative ABC transport system permease protein
MNLGLRGERKLALLPLPVAQKLLKMEGRATELAVAVEPLERADEVAATLRAELGPAYEVHGWSEVAVYARQVITRQDFVTRLIASAFLLLMLLGVANTMLMSVVERTREIGTMMAVGVRRGRILLLFLTEAVLLGALGAAAGATAGATVVALLGRRGLTFRVAGSPMPFLLTPFTSPGTVAEVVLTAAGGAVLFALYPAYRASRLRPVEALASR